MLSNSFLLLLSSFLSISTGLFRSLPCPNVCLKDGDPVCGNDGKIYKTDCHMRKMTCGDDAEASLDWSECRAAGCAHTCDGEKNPVCGTDATTYMNPCLLRVEYCLRGVELAHYGPCANSTQECPSTCVGAERDGPICGSDGNVYKNSCEMKKETCGQNVVEADRRYCKTTSHCNERCFKISKITCGSDGKLYNNGCQLKRKNCGRHIYEVPPAFCLNKLYRTKCPIDCSNQPAKPVCGSDGSLYSSQCDLDKANCGFPLTTFKKITKVNLKNCLDKVETCKRMSCSDEKNFICGNDGQTYRNLCELQEATCRAGVQIAHYGECEDLTKPTEACPKSCPELHSEQAIICGSDGNVYKSLCELKKQTCGERVVPTSLNRCQTTSHCDADCSSEASKYVCGSDGNLHRNLCEMKRNNCGKNVYRVPVTSCLSLFQWTGCGRVCPPALDPVCGSDGKTYLNSCFMQQESCRARSLGTAVYKKHYGRCGDPHQQPKYLY